MQYEEDELYLRYSIDFEAIRVLGGSLLPTKWSLKTDIIIENEIEDADFNFVLLKLKFWFDQILSKGIIFNRDNHWAIDSFMREGIENNLIITPGEPTDDLISILMYTKMNALADGLLTFSGIDLQSDNSKGLSFIFVGTGNSSLPDNKNWVGERSYFDKPWWHRNDSSTLDLIPENNANLKEIPEFAFSLDFLKDTNKGNIINKAKVIKPEFKPKVINGLRDDQFKK